MHSAAAAALQGGRALPLLPDLGDFDAGAPFGLRIRRPVAGAGSWFEMVLQVWMQAIEPVEPVGGWGGVVTSRFFASSCALLCFLFSFSPLFVEIFDKGTDSTHL